MSICLFSLFLHCCPVNKFLRTIFLDSIYMCSVQFSRSVMSDSLWPHESQHTRPPCPSPTPGVHSNSRPLSRWCHPAISSSVVPFSSCPKSLPAWVFSNESTLRMRWPKYWSFIFSIIPFKKYPGLISFRMDWLDLLAVLRYLSFSFWFTSLCIIGYRFIHLIRTDSNAFLFMAE